MGIEQDWRPEGVRGDQSPRIHSAATADPRTELDDLAVAAFLDALAEVALSVAARRASRER